MRNKYIRKQLILLLLCALIVTLLSGNLKRLSEISKYRHMKIDASWYRAHFFDDEMKENLPELSEECKALYRNVKREAKYFPIPESTIEDSYTVSYVNSWLAERNYKGKSGHEGTDIMAGINERGLYPVVSMTDGVISSLGWLEKGGYRVGITSDSGTYYYYAHLDSYADIEEGDSVKAGELLGFMGDSGYGNEGTRGKFAVHLHMGIYYYDEEREISVNPYYVLLSLENNKLKYAYS